MDDKVLSIASELESWFLGGEDKSQEFFIFLCGGGRGAEVERRREIGEAISSIRGKYRYSVHYPEDMFVELIMGHQRRDLLSLENMLAESAHAVGILLESPGTVAELGAFANHNRLRDKLVLIVEPKYKKSKSFINLGPIRFLRRASKSEIHYLPITREHSEEIARTICDSCREIVKHSRPVEDLTNPLFAYDFYLAIVYVFDPIPKRAVLHIGARLGGSNGDNVSVAAETVVNSLINEGKISCVGNALSCTDSGRFYLLYSRRTKRASASLIRLLTDLRYRVLNSLYRRKVGTKGGAFEI